MTREAYDQLFEKQQGLCAICKKEDNIRLCVDHDHVTGKVRGLLCKNCNGLLGYAHDSVDALQNAIDYLRQ